MQPPDHLCGLGYSPADARQSAAEGEVCLHAERLLNMVHAYCEIRDSWIGWLRGDALSRTLYQRIVPEMRALRDAERRVIDTPSVTLLAVLDYAARARKAVPQYTPRAKIDYPQPPVPDAVRTACERMIADADRPRAAAPEPEAPEAARARAILAAMRAWAGPRLKWGRHRGAPYLRALRRATGLRDITRAERNRLWLSVRPPARPHSLDAGAAP